MSMPDPDVLEVVRKIANEEHCKVFLVGGYLRDLILKRYSLDLDFVVFGNSLKFTQLVAKKLGCSPIVISKSFGIGRIIYRDMNKKRWQLDFVKNRGKDINADLSLRDFTVNALAYPVFGKQKFFEKQWKKELINICGGLKDLNNKSLKEVYLKLFHDDPDRIIRAFRMAATLGFEISSSLRNLICQENALIESGVSEIIRDEWFKILNSRNSYKTIKAMDNLMVFERLFPETKSMKGVIQSRYHHLDVWEHSLEALKIAEKIDKALSYLKKLFKKKTIEYLEKPVVADRSKKLTLFKFAAILHDIAKPQTKQILSDDKIAFYGHDILGMKIAGKIAMRFKLSRKEISTLKIIIANHLRPGFLANGEKISNRATVKFFRDCKEDVIGVLVFSLVDRLSARGEKVTKEILDLHKKTINRLMDSYFNEYLVKLPQRLVTGNDLMEHFSLKPGPLIGKLLNGVREAQLTGAINSREQALELAGSILQKEKA